jgi:uncharacterized membrane protein
MYFLITGSLIFFAVHFYSAFRTRIPGRDARERLGYARFMGTYSVLSIIGFALMIWGYDLARPSALLFTPPSWASIIPFILMLPAFILLVAAYVPRGYIKHYSKHPMLLATILWSFGHLLANGEVNSVILFGGFLVFSLVDRVSVMNRPDPIKKISSVGDVVAVVLGIVAYGITLKFLHPALIGVAI